MNNSDLKASYKLISELFLNPEEREADRIKIFLDQLGDLTHIKKWLTEFIKLPEAVSRNEYIQTLELSPPCPLYMGAHLFDEPSTCNGIGTSARNTYMLELSGVYRHYGFDISSSELPDYIPAMVDFLWLSFDHESRDKIGLRRRFLEHYVMPGLEPLHESLAKYKSPYVLLVSALRNTLEIDLDRLGESPAWIPSEGIQLDDVSLPVLSDNGNGMPGQEMLVPELEVRP